MTGELRPIAFLGLGRMGLPMSVNLARAGYPVRAWNRSSRQIGAIDGDLVVLDTAAAAGAGTDVLVTMLPDLDQVIEVCEGPIGALAHATPGAVVLVMGTVSPVRLRIWAKTLVDRGFRVVDAPVSGGDVGARSGELAIMAGGRDEDVAQVMGPLRAMGSVIRHLGPLGAGQLAKACNQIVVATILTALGEAVTLGLRGGLDIEQLLDILSAGLAGSRALEVKRALIAAHSFSPGGSAAFQHKDLAFALDAGRDSGVALPVAALVDQLYGAMRWTGHGEDDHSGILQITELLSTAQPGAVPPADPAG